VSFWRGLVLLLFFIRMPFAEGLRIGVIFGNYDPVHFGHKIIFRKSIEMLFLDKLYVIPYLSRSASDGETLCVRHQLLSESLRSVAKAALPSIDFLQKIVVKNSDEKDEQVAFEENVLRALSYEEGWDNSFFQIMGTNRFHEFVGRRGMNFSGTDVPRSVVVIKRPGFDQTIPRYLIPLLGRRLFLMDFNTPDIRSADIRSALRRKLKTPFMEPRLRNLIEKNDWYGFGSEEGKSEQIDSDIEDVAEI
jgi:nicotinic acid mononucleotide adenylyltransferase